MSLPPTRFELLARQLTNAAAPLLADRVADLIAERYGEMPPLLDAKGAARYLGCDPASVRRWAREGRIASIRLGDGAKAPMRFDPEALRRELSTRSNGTQCDAIARDVKTDAPAPEGCVSVETEQHTHSSRPREAS